MRLLFALSIGFERLAKLVLVADHAIAHGGAWMDDAALRKIGHDIDALLRACEPISHAHAAQERWGARPTSPIHAAIVANLTDFAKLTRYYNLASLSGGKAAQPLEPIQRWWAEVGTPILAAHGQRGSGGTRRAQAAAQVAPLEAAFFVLRHREAGQPIRSLAAMMQHAQSTAVVQRHGRLYVMQIVRWLATILAELARDGAYQRQIEAFLALPEPFATFLNDDAYLRGRKTWSIYRP